MKNHESAPSHCAACASRMFQMLERDPHAVTRLEFCPHRATLATIFVSNGRIVHWNLDAPVDVGEVERRARQLGGIGGENVTSLATGGESVH